MTVPTPAPTPQPPEATSREERAAAWLERNRKALAIGAAVVAAVALVTWFMSVASARKERFAQSALEQAWFLSDQGNLPQASTELQRIVTNFGGTSAALEARLSLNQNRLATGQAQLAVEDLRTFLRSNPPPRFRAGGYGLLGVALENIGQPAEAAAAYLEASQAAEMDHIKADALVSAARAFRAAGDTQQAVAALRTVTEVYRETAAFPVAEVRLGELLKGS